MLNLTLITILSFALMLIGLLGVIAPFLPGAPLAWFGLFIYAWFTGFNTISMAAVLIFAGLVALTIVLDFLAPILGAKKYKASTCGIIGILAGAFVGFIVMGPFGVLLGPVLGAFLGELFAQKEPRRALRSAFGALVGFFVGSVLKIILILVMLGFLIAALF